MDSLEEATKKFEEEGFVKGNHNPTFVDEHDFKKVVNIDSSVCPYTIIGSFNPKTGEYGFSLSDRKSHTHMIKFEVDFQNMIRDKLTKLAETVVSEVKKDMKIAEEVYLRMHYGSARLDSFVGLEESTDFKDAYEKFKHALEKIEYPLP